jgi:hypothetical protein
VPTTCEVKSAIVVQKIVPYNFSKHLAIIDEHSSKCATKLVIIKIRKFP